MTTRAFTLDDIRAAADAKYAPVVIEDVELRNVLRLGQKDREKVSNLQDSLGDAESESEMISSIKEILTIVASSKTKASALLDEVGDDLAILVTLFETYSKGSQLGESGAE